MQSSDIPAIKFPTPFANSAGAGFVRPIPVASQIGTEDGAASMTDGFPPLNFDPVAAGGVPPWGADMNGILREITRWVRWQQAGGAAVFDSAFSTAIGGYPRGAMLASASTPGSFFRSLTENNTNNPDVNPTGWETLPIGFPLSTAGLSTNTTLQIASQGSYYMVSGSNPQITLPNAAAASGRAWGFYATVPFALLTQGGAVVLGGILSGSNTVNLLAGQWLCLQSNGTNWAIFSCHPDLVTAAATAGSGRLLNVRTLTGAGTYTPTVGTGAVLGIICGGGGGGAGSTAGVQAENGSGGGSGAWSQFYMISGFAGLAYSMGAGGAGGIGEANGVAGNQSSFGTIVVPGGQGGQRRTGGYTLDPIPPLNAPIPAAAGTGGFLNLPGNVCPTGNLWGFGADGPWGGGGQPIAPVNTTAGPGGPGRAPGAGGGGGHAPDGVSAGSANGGLGANGAAILYEYS